MICYFESNDAESEDVVTMPIEARRCTQKFLCSDEDTTFARRRPIWSWQETGLEEINGDVLDADFWLVITSAPGPTLGGFTPKFLLLPSKVLLTIFVEPSRSPSPA